MLYDYQERMKRRIDAAFGSSRSVMVQMPTGTGKTHLLAAVVNDYVRKDERSIVWIIAHRRELVSQIENTIAWYQLPVCHEKPERCQVRVYSIQWLSRHLDELKDVPALIVIDEAHHALAKTYSMVMNAFPTARNLGMTATPCRLNGKGFTDLFDTLLTTDSLSVFIEHGYLSPYDYVSIPTDSEEALKIDGLEKRAADGDYSVAEMSAVLDVRPSIERLYHTVMEYAPNKKGIVYAIDIDHANHIAEFYSEHGLRAMAISSKTKDSDRAEYVRDFVAGRLQILVNVDIFSEGFDCPDAEFIQLARPTISLAKYLQQVGRGLRVSKDKECCMLLDNVGLYRLFGFPTQTWDWQAMFYGKLKGKGEVNENCIAYMNRLASYNSERLISHDGYTEMVVLCRHDNQQQTTRLFELALSLNEKFSDMREFKNGWMFARHYVRDDGQYSIYQLTDKRHLGKQLIQDEAGIYYTFHEPTETMVRVGRRNPWKTSVNEYTMRNPSCTRNMPKDGMLQRSEYITVPQCLGINGIGRSFEYYYLGKNEADMLVYPSYLQLSKAMDGVRTFQGKDKKWGIMTQDGDYYLMWGLSSVHLYPQGIAYVKEEADNSKRGYWVNLYTMQEFTVQPKPVKCGPVWLLQVGEVYYIQQIRYMAGIALTDKDFVYNEDVFQFLDDYTILKDDVKRIQRLDKGYIDRKDNEYRFMLIPIDSPAARSAVSQNIRRRDLPGIVR